MVQVKSADTNRIVSRINPQVPYEFELSKGGRTKRANEVEDQITELLEALQVDVENAEARFLCRSALTGRADGSTLRAFLALTDKFSPEVIAPKPVIVVKMSDRLAAQYVLAISDQEYTPGEWLKTEDLPNDNWDNMEPDEDGNVVQVIKMGTNGKADNAE